MHPPVDPGLAPTQIYILLGITVATLSWLIKPEFLGQLSTKAIWWCGVLIFVQWLHSVAYTNLEGVHLAINSFGHKLALAGYAVATVWLFNLRWVEAKSRPPRSPTDD